MVFISKKESEIIRRRLPDAHIVRTAKHKSNRHHYYCEESSAVIRLLNELRGIGTNKGGDKSGFKKER